MANDITIGVGFQVDKSQLNSLQQELKNLSRLNAKDLLKLNPDLGSLDKAQKALLEIEAMSGHLQTSLSSAFNPKLGTYNLEKFSTTFKAVSGDAGSTQQILNNVYATMSKGGAAGQAAFRSFANSITSTNVKLTESKGILDKIATTLGNSLKWNLASNAINKMSGTIQQAWGYTKSLDSSLNDIRIVTGQSADEMERFARNANEAAQGLGSSTTDYTNAALIYAQQGLQGQELETRTDLTLEVANVTGQSAKAVSEELTAVWNGYKVSADEAELYIDRLAAVAAKSASNLQELSVGMSRVASSANMMGVGEDQLAAQLSTIISVTRQAPESVGTALKTIYSRMTQIQAGMDEDGATLKSYTEDMANYGISVLDAQGKLRDMGDIFEEVGGKWSNFTKEQQTAIAQTMGGARQYNMVTALFENWDQYTRMMEVQADAAGTLQEQQDTYMESMSAHLQQLSTAGENVFDSIFDGDAKDGIKDLVDGLTLITNGIAGFIDSIGGGSSVLNSFGSLALNVFSDKIGRGIVDLTLKLQAGKVQAQQMSEIFNNANMVTNIPGIDESTQKLMLIKEQAVELSKVLNPGEFQTIFSTINDQVSNLNIAEKLSKEKQNIQDFIQTLNQGTEFKSADFTKALQVKDIFKLDEDQLGIVQQQINKISSAFETATGAANSLNRVVQNLSREGFNSFSQDSQRVQNLKAQLLELRREGGISGETYSKLKKKIEEAFKAKSLGSFKRQMQELDNEISKLYNDFNKNANEFDGLENLKNKLAEIEQAATRAGTTIEQQINKGVRAETISGVVQLSGAFGQLASSINTIKNLGNIWHNDDLSTSEKVLQTITNIGFALPMFINSFKSASDAIAKMNMAQREASEVLDLVNAKTLTKNSIQSISIVLDEEQNLALDELMTEQGELLVSETLYNQALARENMIKLESMGVTAAQIQQLGIENLQTEINTGVISKETVARLRELAVKGDENAVRLLSVFGLTAEATAYEVLAKSITKAARAAKAFVTTPVGFIFAAAAAITAVVLALDALTVSADEVREKSKNLQDEYNDITNELESLNSKLEETKKRIDELNKKDSLTFVEQEELNDLELSNELLKTQIKLEEELQKAKAQERVDNLTEVMQNNAYGTRANINFNQDRASQQSAKSPSGLSGASYLSNPLSFEHEITDTWKTLQEQFTSLTLGDKDAYDKWSTDFQKYINSGEINEEEAKAAQAWYKGVNKEWKDSYDQILQTAKDNIQQVYSDYSIAEEGSSEKDYLRDIITEYAKVIGFFDDNVLGGLANTDVRNQAKNINKDDLYDSDGKFDSARAKKAFGSTWNDIVQLTKEKGYSLEAVVNEILDSTEVEWKEAAEAAENAAQTAAKEFSKAFKSVKELKNNDVISQKDYDEYMNLVGKDAMEAFFSQMYDGTYLLIGAAEDFKKFVEGASLGEQINQVKQSQEEYSNISSTTSLSAKWSNYMRENNADDEGNFITGGVKSGKMQEDFSVLYKEFSGNITNFLQKATRDGVENADNLLKELKNGVSSERFEEIKKSAQQMADELAKAGKAGEAAAESLNREQEKLASMATSVGQLAGMESQGDIDSEEYTKYYNNALSNQAQSFDLNAEETIAQAKVLEKQLKETDGQYTNLSRDAADLAIANKRMNRGIDDLNKNLKNYKNILKDSNKGSEEYTQNMMNLKDNLADIFNLTEGADLSDEFVQKLVDSGKELDAIAAGGDSAVQAINDLRMAVADDYVMNIIADIDDAGLQAEAESAWQAAQEALSREDLTVGAHINGTSGFVTQLNELIQAAGMTKEQVTAMLGSMGMSATLHTEYEPTEMEVPTYTEVVEPSEPVRYKIGDVPVNVMGSTATMPQWGEAQGLKRYTVPGPPQVVQGYQEVVSIETESGGNKSGGGIDVIGSGKPNTPAKTGGSGGGGGKGGSGGQPKKAKANKLTETKTDPFHDVERHLGDLTTAYDKLADAQERLIGDKLIDNLEEQLNLLEEQREVQEEKLEIAQAEADRMADELAEKYKFEFDAATGEVSNYFEIMEEELERLHDVENWYNSLSGDAQEEDANQERLKNAQERYEDLEKALSEYEDMLDKVDDTEKEIVDLANQMLDLELSKIKVKIEVSSNLKDFADTWTEFQKTVAQLADDDHLGAVEYTLQSINNLIDSHKLSELAFGINQELSLLKANPNDKTILEQLRDDTTDLIDSITEVYEAYEDAKDAFEDSIDKVDDLYDKQQGYYDTLKDQLDHLQASYELIYGDEAYDKLTSYYDGILQVGKAAEQNAREEAAYWEQMMASASSPELYNTYLEKYQEATDNLNSKVEENLETIKNMYENAIDDIFKKWADNLTGGVGFDNFESLFDMSTEANDAFLDVAERGFKIQNLIDKWNEAISGDDDIANQNKLTKAMNQQLEILEAKEKLNEKDVELAEKEIELILKQIAIEEAQAAKNQMRLTRDANGNYTYKFTANQDEVNKQQEEYNRASEELYNATKASINDSQKEILSMQKELKEQLAEYAKTYGNNPDMYNLMADSAIESFRQRIASNAQSVSTALDYFRQYGSEWLGQDLSGMGNDELIEFLRSNDISAISADALNALLNVTYDELMAEVESAMSQYQAETQQEAASLEEDVAAQTAYMIQALEDNGVDLAQAQMDLETIAATVDYISSLVEEIRNGYADVAQAGYGTYVSAYEDATSFSLENSLTEVQDALKSNTTSLGDIVQAANIVESLQERVANTNSAMLSNLTDIQDSMKTIVQKANDNSIFGNNITVNADFSGVRSAAEIEEALTNLPNTVWQYLGRR